MKKNSTVSIVALLLVSGMMILIQSCKKNNDIVIVPEYLTLDLPRLQLQHDLYYLLNHDERSVEIEFSEPIDEVTIDGNISLNDKNGSLREDYDLVTNGRNVMLTFRSGYYLKEGWKYMLTIKKGVKSTSGLHLPYDEIIQLRTTAYIYKPGQGVGTDSTARNSIAVISDIHMGDARATNNHYCWFGKNAGALNDFLDYVIEGNQIRQLVILGDLFDEWLIPYTFSPFDSSMSMTDSRDFCLAVANNPVNSGIFDKLRAIALDPDIELIYVRGNHDMLVTQDILEEIIPNTTWAGDVDGLAKYSPVDEMIMEHGHRYDFFNCPQPLVNNGHILPPGYFVSRLYAQGLMEQQAFLPKELWEYHGDIEFLAAWEIALLYTLVHFDMPVPDMQTENVLMSGIDGYTNAFSFDGARDMYAADIEDQWDATQTLNEVPVHLGCCIQAIWNGHSDLFLPAMEEYVIPPAPKTYKVIAFGHTHEPMLAVYPSGQDFTAIYANSGSWINSDESSYEVRTFLMIRPGAWTGSDLDVVSLYQYNLDTENGNSTYEPVLISEESVGVE